MVSVLRTSQFLSLFWNMRMHFETPANLEFCEFTDTMLLEKLIVFRHFGTHRQTKFVQWVL